MPVYVYGNYKQAVSGIHYGEEVKLFLPTKQTPWPLVHKQTIPTERPPLVGEI
jgi:hypothetical protein